MERRKATLHIDYFDNGFPREIAWRNEDGELDRNDGPARVVYWKNGVVRSREYRIKNVLHREDGPAFECFFINGEKRKWEYYHHGDLHREKGEAFCIFSRDITAHTSGYAKFGKILSKSHKIISEKTPRGRKPRKKNDGVVAG